LRLIGVIALFSYDETSRWIDAKRNNAICENTYTQKVTAAQRKKVMMWSFPLRSALFAIKQ
jgi:hypothetical protein